MKNISIFFLMLLFPLSGFGQKYDSQIPFGDKGYAIVCKNHKCGIIDKTGKEVVPLKYDTLMYSDNKIIEMTEGWADYVDIKHFDLSKPLPEPVSPPSEESPTSDKTYMMADELPVFTGGTDIGYFIGNNIRYPQLAVENEVEGRVTEKFVVEKDGSVTDVTTTSQLGYGLEEEAIRMIKKTSGLWKPAMAKSQPSPDILPSSYTIQASPQRRTKTGRTGNKKIITFTIKDKTARKSGQFCLLKLFLYYFLSLS